MYVQNIHSHSCLPLYNTFKHNRQSCFLRPHALNIQSEGLRDNSDEGKSECEVNNFSVCAREWRGFVCVEGI